MGPTGHLSRRDFEGGIQKALKRLGKEKQTMINTGVIAKIFTRRSFEEKEEEKKNNPPSHQSSSESSKIIKITPATEMERKHICSGYYDLLKYCFTPSQYLSFRSIAEVPLQDQEELGLRAPLPNLNKIIAFLQQFGVVIESIQQDKKHRYYVDVTAFNEAF